MVKLSFTSIFFFLVTLSTTVLTSPIELRDVKSIEQCLRHLSTDASKLASAVNAVGDTTTYSQALAINDKVDVVKGDLNQCYNDVNAVHAIPPDNDAKTILGIFEGLEPIIVDALNGMVKKKNVFEQLPFVVQFILPQLKALYGGSTKLETGLNALTPSNYKEEATSIENKINAAFENAIKAYSQ